MKFTFKDSIINAIITTILLCLFDKSILEQDNGIVYYLGFGVTLVFVVYLFELAIYKFKNRKK